MSELDISSEFGGAEMKESEKSGQERESSQKSQESSVSEVFGLQIYKRKGSGAAKSSKSKQSSASSRKVDSFVKLVDDMIDVVANSD